MSLLVPLVMAASVLGWGALALRACGVSESLAWRERVAWSFALGIGILGWLAFFPPLLGRVDAAAFTVLCLPGLFGLWWLRGGEAESERPTLWTWALLAVLLLLALGDLAEGLAPPTDADSLAYHFAIPRQILLHGQLIFVPRAADGAIPLLQQMTSLAALALGGEPAMTLWCGLSGWAAVFLTYAVARRHLSRDWSLAAAVAMAGVPAFLYGAGSGQVEARLAAFATMAVLASMESRRRSGLGWAVLAGLAAGLCMASKYPGLLVAFLCGLAVLLQRGGVVKASVFSAAALGLGAQWYGWNWWNTGDPVFPMLFGLVPYHAGVPWNEAQNAAFKLWGATIEAPLPRGVLDILAYPLRVTFFPPDALDAGRTGLGVLPILLAPFAALGAWRYRAHPIVRAWAVAALIGLGFYLLWSVFGASQRVRHYLPFMPLVLVGLLVAAVRVGPRLPLAAGLAAVIMLQLAGQAVFARTFVHRLVADEDRTAFIERNVAWAYGVTWANAHLPADARVVTNVRQWIYLLERPVLFVTPVQQAEVQLLDDRLDVTVFWTQMRARGITHVILPFPLKDIFDPPPEGDRLAMMMARLERIGCASVERVLTGPAPAMSRTLASNGQGNSSVTVLALTPATCRLETR
ncbi:hypothetical protein A6A04_03355 [Paramagnetospirillum marisnigri]|uniref:Glycosyltransferase RgtA/B/C/D-like domain-containing protein n=1 Tax=Paramagnetospirillum marisnigri TaxID=1285242 RepID=A0A178MMK3_9PROT|nr:glycosyltransferase family 39 protein [Paramagnetospirillum marisnigri]OAN49164.1 hypothetical protein A6A04_03355 [Paramagnetospirillum marisnigri]